MNRGPFVDHDGTYLLSHSIGLAIRGSREAVDPYFQAWEHDPVDAWPRWLTSIDEFRSTLADLLGGDMACVCPQANVSSGLVKVLGAVRSSLSTSTPVVLLTEDAFPSLGFASRRAGYEVRFIGRDEDALDPGVWHEHLRSDVDVVCITHVHSNTGELVPVDLVADVARRCGVLSVVDVAQSVGVIPIDVRAWDADVLVGSCVKWLSGGPGAGWLWASPDTIDRSRPTDVGWFSHADPFEFDIHRYRDADDALRFWGGSPSVLPYLVALHSIRAIASLGVGAIRARNLEASDRLIERLGDRVVSPHDQSRRSGTCIVDGSAAAARRLVEQGIAVDHRSRGIRLSPHVHTSDDDIDSFVEQLDQPLSGTSAGAAP